MTGAIRNGRTQRIVLLAMLCCGLSMGGGRPSTGQVALDVLHVFNAYSDGTNPDSKLLQGEDGGYYGTTIGGGSNGGGTLFKITSTGNLNTLHSFTGNDGESPMGGLIQGRDGGLYGTTRAGGRRGGGVAFKIDPDGSNFKVLYTFDPIESWQPNGVTQAGNGDLYGTTQYGGTSGDGVVFRLAVSDTSGDGARFQLLHSFQSAVDGQNPTGGLIQARNGLLYGTTQAGSVGPGTLFQISPSGTQFKTLHVFSFTPTDGATPRSGVIQGADGALYGVTAYGGVNNSGTLFRIDTDGSNFSILHSFTSSVDGFLPDTSLVQGSDGSLYGTALFGGPNNTGCIYKVSQDGVTFSVLHSFATSNPVFANGVILGSDGLIHGTTSNSGAPATTVGNGTVYTLTTDGTTYTTLFDFESGYFDGRNPDDGSLALSRDGYLYGTTLGGGLYNQGTIFRVDPLSGEVTQVYSFSLPEFSAPHGGVIAGPNGTLYGTINSGGGSGSGILYSYVPATGAFTKLYTFSDNDDPSGLTFHGDLLYGVSSFGGAKNYGDIFRLSLPSASRPATLIVLHSFTDRADGGNPRSRLVWGPDQALYGVTGDEGSNAGTVFRITPSGGFKVLYRFQNHNPSGLMLGADGALYGTANGVDADLLFRLDTNGSAFTVLHRFTGSRTSRSLNPGLIQGSDGALYGTTRTGGMYVYGTVYRINTDGSGFTILHSFRRGVDGAYAEGGVTEGPDGNLYGTTSTGGIEPYPGTAVAGTVYRLLTNLAAPTP